MVKFADPDKQVVASDGTSFPANPVGCQIFHRTDLDKSYMYTGGQWKEIGKTFGCVQAYAESEGESTTTSLSYVEKLKLTTPTLEAGSYYLAWSFGLANSNKDGCTGSRVEVDDTTIISETCRAKTKNNNEYVAVSGFKIMTLSAGVHTIDIDYNAVSDTAAIRRARLLLWRCA